METLLNTLPIIQIVFAVALIIAILLQQRGAGLGSAFGGGDNSNANYERRGFERTLFKGTIIIAILFVVSIIASVFIDKPLNIENIPSDSTATSTSANATSTTDTSSRGLEGNIIISTSTPTTPTIDETKNKETKTIEETLMNVEL